MKAKHVLQNVLTKFAEKFNHNTQNASPAGCTHITINYKTTIQIDFDEEKESVTIIAPITFDDPDIYADVLAHNMFRDQLAGARFVLLRETNQIALLAHFDLKNLSSQEVEILFQKFIDVTHDWAEKLESKYVNKIDDSDTIPMLIYNDIFNRA